MRTTIRIDDDLYRQVKQTAARTGRTVSAVLEDAVRQGLSRRGQNDRGRFRIRPLGSGGLRPGVDLSSNASVAEAIDEDSSIDALR